MTSPISPPPAAAASRDAHRHLADIVQSIRQAIGKVVVGPDDVVDRPHGPAGPGPRPPGGGAGRRRPRSSRRSPACWAAFRRVQFTPDLLPSDITGTYILDMRRTSSCCARARCSRNVLLGERSTARPAKTQSALLEAMQEHQVTIEGETCRCRSRSSCWRRRTPIEQEGTYPLPEAQLDRFLVRVRMGYPAPRPEIAILEMYGGPSAAGKPAATRPADHGRPAGDPAPPEPIVSTETILTMPRYLDAVYAEPTLMPYVVDLARACREHPDVALGREFPCIPVPAAMLAGTGTTARPELLHPQGHPRSRAGGAGPPAHPPPEAEGEGGPTDDVIAELLAMVPIIEEPATG